MRLEAVRLLFPDAARELARYRGAFLWWGPLSSLVSLLALLRSIGSRTIEWRGVRYHMVSPRETIVLDA